jgi:hypothetical protein
MFVNLVTPKAAGKHEILFNKQASVVSVAITGKVTRRFFLNSPNFWECSQNCSQKSKLELKGQNFSIKLLLNAKIGTTNHVLKLLTSVKKN